MCETCTKIAVQSTSDST